MSTSRRHAIVTGAASGLGRAICLGLARDGWNIAVCDINATGSAETVSQVQAAGGEGHVEQLDVSDPQAWQDLSVRLRQRWQYLDLLVNNAGVAGAGEVGDYPLDDWHWMLNINLWNGIYGCHTFVDWLKQNPRGAHIINTASMAAMASAPTMAAYNVSKSGMVALSETLYGELMPHNVGVTVLCPAFFATNLLTGGRFADERMRDVAEKAFRKSKFTADDVARAALRAMQRRQFYVVLPNESKFYWYFKRLMPQRFLQAIARRFAEGLPDDL